MHITTIRHGETQGNVDHIVQSRTGDTLTDAGRQQAVAAAKLLQNKQFDVVYSSDLSRCIETAQIVLAGRNDKLIVTECLRERNQGIYEGKHWEAVPWLEYEGDNVAVQIPDGESWLLLQRRIGVFIGDLYRKHPEHQVLFITHVGPIKALRALLTGMPLRDSIDQPVLNGTVWEWEMQAPLWH